MYENILVIPMREEVTKLGFKQILNADEVDSEITKKGLTLVFINSVCGCAAGKARPGLKLAVEWAKQNNLLPENLYTVFAGIDKEAAEKVRTYIPGFAPSSPSVAMLKDGKLVSMIQRFEIENAEAETVAIKIINLFKQHCN